MPNKFSRTEIVDGQPVVTLFATGLNCIDRQISMLEELSINNKGCDEICGPAVEARDALALLKSRVNMPKTKSADRTTPDKSEDVPPLAPQSAQESQPAA